MMKMWWSFIAIQEKAEQGQLAHAYSCISELMIIFQIVLNYLGRGDLLIIKEYLSRAK
jgi:hypothetical protein